MELPGASIDSLLRVASRFRRVVAPDPDPQRPP
jgi:hypothetical protein